MFANESILLAKYFFLDLKLYKNICKRNNLGGFSENRMDLKWCQKNVKDIGELIRVTITRYL